MRAVLRLFWTSTRASVAIMMGDMPPYQFFFIYLPRTVLQILFFTYLAKAAGGNSLATFAFIGNIIHVGVYWAFFNMSDTIQYEKWNGTLEFLIAAPSNWVPTILGKSMASYAELVVRTTLACAIMIPLFHLPLTVGMLLRSLPIAVIVFLSASALGWLLGVFCMPIRWGNLIINTLGYVMIILCGVNFPFSFLPPFVQVIGNLLPLTHGLLAIRAVIAGASYASVWPLIRAEILIGLVYAAIAWLMFAQGLRITRQRGSFELV